MRASTLSTFGRSSRWLLLALIAAGALASCDDDDPSPAGTGAGTTTGTSAGGSGGTSATGGGGAGGGSGGSELGLALAVVSSASPDWVSGGDALVRVLGDLPPDSSVHVILNGADVSRAFQPDPEDGRPIGLITGLTNGNNTLTAELYRSGSTSAYATAALTITNYPKAGPMFSGPHETPFLCETQAFALPDGTTLGPALDSDCSITTRVQYFYRSTVSGSGFLLLGDLHQLPADVATTTTSEGKTVPYVVRVETGTANRAIYQTSILHDPTQEGEAPSFVNRPAGWNGRLVYSFGGGCTGGWYRQGSVTGGVLDDNILRQGYAMASSSLNVFGNNCQDLTSSESMAMVKERFIEAYGAPRYTMGWGCSGGSYQQHQIADNYPGLLDGILPGCSFPEVGFATVYSITDMRLLGNYFQNVVPGQFTEEQQRHVAGVQTEKTIFNSGVYEGAMRISPTTFCPSVLPVEQRYHPVNNPTGVRCDVYDHTVNVYGTDPATGFALRPIDNVGVQYGMRALNAGVITVDQFLDLNERVGGYDDDANFTPQRTAGSLAAIRQAYRSGRLTNGGGGLKDIPIIDYRAYTDDQPNGDIHLRYHSFSLRERLIKANGDADNHVMLVEDYRYGFYSSGSPLLLDALSQLDQWLANIAADTTTDPQHAKVVHNKPATLQEGCMTRAADPTKIVEPLRRDAGECATLYPAPGAPRFAAGASIDADVIKCQLKPVDMNDYTVAFTAAQQARLTTIFPGGVCNWALPGVEQQPLAGTWQKF